MQYDSPGARGPARWHGDDRETEIDCPGSSSVFEIIHFTKRQNKGEDAILVIHQDVARHTTFQTAKSERRAYCESQGIDGTDGIGAKGDDVGVIAHLHSLFLQLVDDGTSVDISRKEGQDVAALQLADDLDGYLVARCAAYDGGKTGGCAVHELHAPFPEDDVICRAQPDLSCV